LHARQPRGEVIDGIDERDPLEQHALLPQESVEHGRVVAAQPAPEDEQVAGCHDGGGIELERAQPAHGVEHPGRRAVEKLGPYGDAPGLLAGQRDGRRHRRSLTFDPGIIATATVV
jgi:hypothetical protein